MVVTRTAVESSTTLRFGILEARIAGGLGGQNLFAKGGPLPGAILANDTPIHARLTIFRLAIFVEVLGALTDWLRI